jgi:YbbR domain-containing protein
MLCGLPAGAQQRVRVNVPVNIDANGTPPGGSRPQVTQNQIETASIQVPVYGSRPCLNSIEALEEKVFTTPGGVCDGVS